MYHFLIVNYCSMMKKYEIPSSKCLQNGGITLEMTEAAKNLPDWTPATASKWDAASLDFAKESIGDVTVLVGPGGIRDSSTFSRVEFSELLNNKNVDSINFVYIE